jgi:hypothetical protein
MFQYHLQHGLLTVNEARARMGMPPVPWGDVRVNTEPFPDTPACPTEPRQGNRLARGTPQRKRKGKRSHRGLNPSRQVAWTNPTDPSDPPLYSSSSRAFLKRR